MSVVDEDVVDEDVVDEDVVVPGVVGVDAARPVVTDRDGDEPLRLARCRGDAGTGLFSMIGSFLVFILLLLFAVQLLVGLYARSVAAGAAFDGATYRARHADVDKVPLETALKQLATNQVGASLNHVEVPPATADYVEFTVVVNQPRFLSQAWLPGGGTISRTARARIEKKR